MTGRPRKEPSIVIGVPVDRLEQVEEILGRKIAVNQVPIIKVRVPVSAVDKIRKALSKW